MSKSNWTLKTGGTDASEDDIERIIEDVKGDGGDR